jgi:hypothetical protein
MAFAREMIRVSNGVDGLPERAELTRHMSNWCSAHWKEVNTGDMAPEYGRIPEACRRYGLSRSRLYLLAGDGLVRFVKVGNATLVDRSAITWLRVPPPRCVLLSQLPETRRMDLNPDIERLAQIG